MGALRTAKRALTGASSRLQRNDQLSLPFSTPNCASRVHRREADGPGDRAAMNAPIMFGSEARRHCRRCRVKLAEPVENPRSAFCCRGCYRQFYAKRCLACEREMDRTAGHQKLCGSATCRREYRAMVAHHIGGKFDERPQGTFDGGSPSANPIKQGVCGPEKADRPWRQVAGPALSPVELRLATAPIDKATAARVGRANRDYARDDTRTLIKRGRPPLNVRGGYKWPDAPSIISRGVGAP
jgi:hypothetical protein